MHQATAFHAQHGDSCNKSVLVVEDDPLSQLVVSTYLEASGFKFDLVGTGKDAIRLARKKCYSLILMDIGLPDCDGISLTREIRKYEVSPKNTCIVALTAHSENTLSAECAAAGMDGFITKPISYELLLKILHFKKNKSIRGNL